MDRENDPRYVDRQISADPNWRRRSKYELSDKLRMQYATNALT
jgi:hypothetical protein